MQIPTPKQEHVDNDLRPSRKRKVQWADEHNAVEQLAFASNPESDAGAHVDKLEIPQVRQHGMLVPTHANVQHDAEQAHSASPAPGTGSLAQKRCLASQIYNPIEYGDFRSYMKHKRAKLKVQEASLLEEQEALLRVQHSRSGKSESADSLAAEIQANGGKRSDALKGCCVYINGQTYPPYSELRRLLVLHGGDLMAYLDQKTPVTHIVASNLTPKKRIEFKDYKVVLPGWILESIELGRKADWRKWRCDAMTGSNGHSSNSMVGKLSSHILSSEQGLGDWRNLDRSAKMPRQLPRIGNEDESPWGIPTKQTNLLDRFTRIDKPQPQQSNRARSKQTSEKASNLAPHEQLEAPKTEVAAKGVRFREDHVILPAHSTDSSNIQGTCNSTLIPPVITQATTTNTESARHVWNDASTRSGKEGRTPDEIIVTPTKPASRLDYNTGTHPAASKAKSASGRGHYASRPSNTHAARLLASPSWRERNTATSESFLAGYFAKSRLHHLSTWKTSLQDMVSSALREAGRPLGSSDLPNGVQRVIMHIDFDSFFVAVGLKKRPDLQDKPVVVCHGTGTRLPTAKPAEENKPADNQSSSTSEIASCSYTAREFGIRNGMSLGQAKRLCPHVETIPYDFESCNSISLTFYAFLLEHSDALQAVSVDEALVDVSLLLQSMRNGNAAAGSLYDRYRDHLGSQGQAWTAEKQLAEAFRDEIRERCGCEASVGIGSNILLARLATRKAKPGGSFHLTDQAKQPFLDALNVDDLHGIGWSLRDRMRELFETINIGKILSKTNARKLVAEFGPKKGKMIWEKMHGIDADRLEGNKLRQSVGSHVNYGIRFLTEQEAENFVAGMCQEVAQRARAVKLRGRQVSVQVMVRAKDAPVEAPKFLGHGVCDTHHRSVQVSGPGGVAIDDEVRIRAAAWPLIQDLKADPKELRGIAISLNKLEPADGNVLSPAKLKGGQSLLSFGSTASTKSDISRFTNVKEKPASSAREDGEGGSDAEQPGEPGVEMPASFEKGPKAATPRRPNSSNLIKSGSARSPESQDSSMKLPPATQLMLPSKSQIDPDVFDALPTPYRRQIEAKFESSFDRKHEKASGENLDCSPPTSSSVAGSQLGSQGRLRVLPRSTPTTPQKAKAAPSPTMAETLMLPSASQIDPAVLAELPHSVRKEIERQVGLTARESSPGPSSVENTPTSAARRKNASNSTLATYLRQYSKSINRKNALFRSVSESPTKKRVAHRLLQTAGNYAAADQPVGDRDTMLAMDPSKISTEALKALGIDAEVFHALPIELQRETFRYHSEQKRSEKARFKAGKTNTFVELTLAEQRRRATLRAAQNEIGAQKQMEQRLRAHKNDGYARTKPKKDILSEAVGTREDDEEEAIRNAPFYLIARPRWRQPRAESHIFSSTDDSAQHNRSNVAKPSIRGLSRYPDVEKLIRQWVSAFANKGPRTGDVDRIGAYLADVVRVASESKVEDMQNASALVDLIETQIETKQGDTRFAKHEWDTAKERIRNTVQALVRKTFHGAELGK